jgi:hypothetical protein
MLYVNKAAAETKTKIALAKRSDDPLLPTL